MAVNVTASELDTIFDVPKNGSNIREESEETQEGSYAEVVEAAGNASFDQKAASLAEKLQKDAPPAEVEYRSTPEEKSDVKQPIASKTEPAKPSKPIETTSASLEEILSQSVSNKQPPQQTLQPLASQPPSDSKAANGTETSEDEDEIRTIDKSVPVTTSVASPGVTYDLKANEDGWLLNPPAPMYAHFYKEKVFFIRHITKNGKLDINKLTAELKNSSVSTAVELSDLKGMAEKLTKIQDFLDRVVQIKVQATGQCVAAKRGVELLRGVLAGITYEKPAVPKQDGINYMHMRDIELYASELTSLEQNAKDIYHNLLEAKEILSRKVSIAIELLKEQNKLDNMDRNFNTLPDDAKKAATAAAYTSRSNRLAIEGYDRLEPPTENVKTSQPKAPKPIGKTGQVDWLD